MIILLDDLSRCLYKKLKTDEDSLAKILLAIEYKKKLVTIHMEMYFTCLENKITTADDIYLDKYKLEVEISSLEREAESLKKRIMNYVSSQTRSA